MNAFVFIATGWQPGHDLFERNREKFASFFAKQHGERGYPHRDYTPEHALENTREIFGLLPGAPYVLDTNSSGRQFVSNGMFSKLLPPPFEGCKWDIYAPAPGQGPDHTIISDGIVHYYAGHFFTGDDTQAAPACGPQAAPAFGPPTSAAAPCGLAPPAGPGAAPSPLHPPCGHQAFDSFG